MGNAVESNNLSAAKLPWRRALLLLLLSILLTSRNPQLVLHPTLWAEDGKLWFRDAYNFGARQFLAPHTGYLQTYPRLIAWLGRLIKVDWLPAWFMAAGLIMQMAPVALLLQRGSAIIPSPWARAAIILFYLGMPNSAELYLHLTDAQWHFGLVLFLLVILPPPRRPVSRFCQCAVLALGGLSGPFSIVIAPLAWWQWAETAPLRRRFSLIQAALLSATALVQTGFVITGDASRFHSNLGAGIVPLARILGGQIFLAGSFGVSLLSQAQNLPLWRAGDLPLALSAFGLAIVIFTFSQGSSAYRKFVVLAALIFAAGLASPVISLDQPQWQAMAVPGVGCRYYFFPLLAWFTAVLLLIGHRNALVRMAGCVLLPCFLIGVAADWRYDPSPAGTATAYRHAAKLFAHAAPGTEIIFPADPASVWNMRLIKH